MSTGIDPKCVELAEHFLPHATKEYQMELADDLQDAVDTFCRWLADREAEKQ